MRNGPLFQKYQKRKSDKFQTWIMFPVDFKSCSFDHRVLTGLGSEKKVAYTSFTAAKSAISVRKMLTLTASWRLDPPASRTALRLRRICRCSHFRKYITDQTSHLSYCSVLDGSFHHFTRGRVYSQLARAVDHVADDHTLR